MKKDGIFLKIFTAAAIISAAFMPAAAKSGEQRESIFVTGEGENARSDELTSLYRQLASLYHLNPRRSPITLEVVLSPAIPADEPELKLAGKKWIAAINSDPVQFSSSPALRRKLYSIMLAAAAGIEPPPGSPPAQLPEMTFLGIDSIIRGWQGPERWVRGNRRLNVIRALLAAKSLPEPETWLPEAAEFPAMLSPAAYIWCSELARTAVESGSRNIFNRRRLAGYLTHSGRNDLEFLNGLAGGGTQTAMKFYYQAVRAAWSEYNPRPPEQTLKELALWRQRSIDELGADGKATGKKITVDIFSLFPMLKKRPDAREIVTRTAGDLLNAANGDCREFKAAATDTASAIAALPQEGYPEHPEEIRRKIARLTEITERRIVLGKRLDAAAAQHTPLPFFCGVRLQTVRNTPQAASQAISSCLDRAAENF